MSASRRLANLAPYGFVEVSPAQSQSPGPSDFIELLVLSLLSYFPLVLPLFLLYIFILHLFFFFCFYILSKYVLEQCLFACCKTCVDKYQFQVNDTVNEHCRFLLPFSCHEGDNAWKGGKDETVEYFSYICYTWLHSLPIKGSYMPCALIIPYFRLLRQMWQQSVLAIDLYS